MTPFGAALRRLRAARGLSLKRMASDLQLSPAYLSALEHGHRSRPSAALVIQICSYFNIIWDEADNLERLAALSHPRVVVRTAGLSPRATELANRLAATIGELSEDEIEGLLGRLEAATPPTGVDRRRPHLRRGRR